MARRRISEAQVLRAVSAFVVMVTVLIAPLAQAQVTSKSPMFGKSSVAGLEAHNIALATADSSSLLFLPAMPYNTGGRTTAVADLNGDGNPDLVTANSVGTLVVWLGNGDGRFASPVSSPLGSGPSSLVIADVNGDHKPDVVIGSAGRACGYLSCFGVFVGNGDGTFRPTGWYSSDGYSASTPAVADVNGDGKPDLLVANGCDEKPAGCVNSSLKVFLGNGDGTFQRAGGYAFGGVGVGGMPHANVMIADLNRDNKPDVLVISCTPDEHRWCSTDQGLVSALLGNGDGTFRTFHSYSVGILDLGTPPPVVIADINRDGKPDLLVANLGVGHGQGEGSAEVLLGNGDGTFQPAVPYDSGAPRASSIAVADLNADDLPDLVLAHGDSYGKGSVGVLLGRGDGTFEPAHTYAVHSSESASGAMITDLNGDAKPDIVLASNCVTCNLGLVDVLLGNGDGTFQATQTYFSGGYNAFALSVADMNGDGKPDLVATNSCSSRPDCNAPDSGTMGVLLNNGGALATTIRLVSSANPVLIYKPVTYTATVTLQSGESARGTVSFLDGFNLIETIPLDGNLATVSLPYRYISSHPIRAAYSGDLNNALGSISSTLMQNVAGTSRTAVTTSGSPSLIGQPVTFTAKVSSYWGTIPDSELVTFADGAIPLGSAALVNGVASYTTSSLTTKTHVIKAVYGGDTRFLPSSGIVSHLISKYTTSTALASSLNPSIYGQAVTWAAMVTTSGSVPPTGSVVFRSSQLGNPLTLGTAALNANGMAMLTKSNLTATYPYPITAAYVGDALNASGTSAVLNQIVRQTTTAASITSSPNPSSRGQAVTFTAKITSPTVVVTGPVTFSVGSTTLGTAQLSGGVAKFTTSALPVGASQVKVTYYGNSNVAKSSAMLVQTVN